MSLYIYLYYMCIKLRILNNTVETPFFKTKIVNFVPQYFDQYPRISPNVLKKTIWDIVGYKNTINLQLQVLYLEEKSMKNMC